MLVVFKNKNSNDRIFYGTLLTSIKKIEEGCLYIDAIDCLDIVTSMVDWKNQYVTSVSIYDIKCFVDDYQTIKRYFPEEFI